VKIVTEGAERIAQGDLQTRLPVKSTDEFGQLALAFNRMAEDLSEHQRRLFAEARARQEQEVQQRVFALDYERKSVELEDARRFQLSMLPKQLPAHERYDVSVFTKTATEVGGDYYDFHLADDGVLSITIGDATGHGARAGTMVTVIKTLFAGYRSTTAPAEFLRDAAGKIKRMDLGRMAMALALARFDRSRMTVASAGMPPVLIHHHETNEVEEVTLPATPLGTLGMEYAQKVLTLSAGDTVLLMSDGWPELQNAQGLQLGYPNALQEFRDAAAAGDAAGVVQHLASAVHTWHGDGPPNDDITFVVVRVR
jgi:serine phosphatase RsbU (regulator of sigma subunit)